MFDLDRKNIMPINEVSVVLPVYNEEENIEETVRDITEYLQKNKFNFEIIAVNDGSLDNSGMILHNLCETNDRIVAINSKKNEGYGKALRKGLMYAKYSYIICMDSDGQFEIKDIEKMMSFINEYDCIIGVREYRADSVFRIFLGKIYTNIINIIFDLNIKDMDCGLKLIKKTMLEHIKLISNGSLFSAELILKIKKNGWTVKQVPVNHYPRVKGKATGVNLNVVLLAIKELILLILSKKKS